MSEHRQSHLVKGLLILGERWANGPRRWIAAGEGPLDTAVRVAMVAAGAYVGWRLVSRSWLVLGAAVLVVVVLALRAATKAVTGDGKGDGKKPAPAVKTGPASVDPDAFTAAVWEHLGDFKAIHLATLATHLTDATGEEWTTDRVRAACKAAQIPIRPKVRDLGGDRVSSGIHRDDLPPLPQPLPEEAQEGPVDSYTAGHDGNATPLHAAHATTPTPTTRRVGDLRVTSIPDADNPHRTHVAVVDPTAKRVPR